MSFSMERRRPGTPRRDAIRGRGEVTGEPRLLEPRKNVVRKGTRRAFARSSQACGQKLWSHQEGDLLAYGISDPALFAFP